MSRRTLVSLALMLFLYRAPSTFAQTPQSSAGPEPPHAQGETPRRERGNGNSVFGRIQSVSATEMKIAQADGQMVTVRISSKTVFRIDRKEAQAGDFKEGTTVFVRGTKSADNVWDADLVTSRTGPASMPEGLGKEFVIGEVKLIDGVNITVLRPDNVTQMIEADEDTSLKKHGESITLADIRPGDTIMARGGLKAGKFVPKTLTVMDPDQVQRMRQFMGSGGAPGAKTGPPAGEQKPSSGARPPQEPR
jgi:preprotein translocase subunit YajC